jgi:hypothetical protein
MIDLNVQFICELITVVPRNLVIIKKSLFVLASLLAELANRPVFPTPELPKTKNGLVLLVE